MLLKIILFYSPASKVLRSLDLSYNKLSTVPWEAIKPLKTLEWLNLFR
jgi:Leucine-rich repeat (LRR) protein